MDIILAFCGKWKLVDKAQNAIIPVKMGTRCSNFLGSRFRGNDGVWHLSEFIDSGRACYLFTGTAEAVTMVAMTGISIFACLGSSVSMVIVLRTAPAAQPPLYFTASRY